MPFSSPADQIKAVLQTLQQSFGAPLWREPLPAVDELISTILSQNTNDVNRDRAFYALRQTFADWEAVRAAPEEEIIAAVRVAGLGFTTRLVHSTFPFWRICRWRKPATGCCVSRG